MNPIHPIASGNETRGRARRTAVLLAVISAWVGASIAAAQQHAEPEATPAVLKIHEFSFFYRSAAAHFSCSALEHRVAVIMVSLGARSDIHVRANNCQTVLSPTGDRAGDMWQGSSGEWPNSSDRWSHPSDRWGTSSDRWGTSSSDTFRNRSARQEQQAHIHVRAMLPVEVTHEVLEEIRRDKSRRELISRVTGDPAASLDDPIVFPAQRQAVTLSHGTIKLEPVDCELLEQMSRSVFRKLGMRVVGGRPSCNRDQVSRIPPSITVETLMPLMPSDPHIEPAAGDDAPPAPETEAQEPETPLP